MNYPSGQVGSAVISSAYHQLPPVGPATGSMDCLGTAVGQLEDLVSEMESKLAVVLKPDLPQASNPVQSGEPQAVIRDVLSRFANVRQRMGSILNRIDL